MARAKDPLATYNAKRDFQRTAEPAGQVAPGADNIFMVQKHDATRLHWDFRLELDGVLKSWAVTRGPSLDPDDKRLAVRTEDHPMAYATFEGTIPKGEYGGGTVMLWDRGTWTSHPGKDPRKTIAEGHLHFTLDGERMKGEWIMVRLKPRPGEKRENWLLRKVADQYAGGSGELVDQAITSVETGRTMAEIAAGVDGKRVWRSNKGDALHSEEATAPKPKEKKTHRRKQPLPAFRPPQLATLVDHVPPGSGWLHEIKYDGYRTLIAVADGTAKAYTRTGLDWSEKFASIVAAAAALPGSALLDGEVVALDAKGHPSFQLLQATLKNASHPLAYFAFDLLEQDGEDLTSLPNVERKQRLAALFSDVSEPLHYADHVTGNGEGMFQSLCAEGMEGLISKRADAPYSSRRTQAWLKVKCIHRQEFVIVGWLPSDKSRGFRSLLLGVHDDGTLKYAGKAGTGFNAATMTMLLDRMKPLARKTSTVEAPRAAVRGAQWIEPELVAEIAYTERTGDGVLRHPSFIALREDKPAKEVVREIPSMTVADAAPAAVPIPGITNPDRVIFPESNITKGQLAAYYQKVAEPLLKWTAGRPVSLVRCPQGRAKHCFFQKHDAGSFGAAVHHVPVREKDGSTEDYLYLDSVEGVLACIQMGTIELHGWGSRVPEIERPDRLVFDLDPDEGLGFDAVRSAAVQLRDILGELGLRTWPLLSGGKGVHVVAPLDATAEWPEVKDFASRFAKAMEQSHPDRFTANMKKVERRGRIFLDWLRNQRGATAIMPYAVRARANAPVAAPIGWDELVDTTGGNRFTIADADLLLQRAASKALKGWCIADQRLPVL